MIVAKRLPIAPPHAPQSAGGSRRQRRLRSRDWLPPIDWAEWAEGRPPVAVCNHLSGALIQRWSRTAPAMLQPPLDHHLLVLHLGGPKRIVRAGGLGTAHVDIGAGAFTMVPAGSSYRWLTSGPIDFAQYPATDRYQGRPAAPNFTTTPEEARFRSHIEAAQRSHLHRGPPAERRSRILRSIICTGARRSRRRRRSRPSRSSQRTGSAPISKMPASCSGGFGSPLTRSPPRRAR